MEQREDFTSCLEFSNQNNVLFQQESWYARHFYYAFQFVPQAVIVVNTNQKIDFVNVSACNLLKYSFDELLQLDICTVLPTHSQQILTILADINDFTQLPQPISLSTGEGYTVIQRDNSELFVDISLSFFESLDGRHLIFSLNDVHQHKETQQELLRSNTELDQFAYIASHDLKAPLRGLSSLATWINEDIDNQEKVAGHLHVMRNRIQRMQALLDDLLDFSRVGKLSTEVSQIDLGDLVQELYLQCAPPRSFKLIWENQPFVCETQVIPLSQVVRNLINNAVKHNDKEDGYVKLSAWDQNDHIKIEVADNGPGIKREFFSKIFEMFEKLRPHSEVEGSGIGLAMVKRIVESRGGSVTVASQLNEGSYFTVLWPK